MSMIAMAVMGTLAAINGNEPAPLPAQPEQQKPS